VRSRRPRRHWPLKPGVTTLVDSYGVLPPSIVVRERINRGEAMGSRLVLAGNIIVAEAQKRGKPVQTHATRTSSWNGRNISPQIVGKTRVKCIGDEEGVAAEQPEIARAIDPGRGAVTCSGNVCGGRHAQGAIHSDLTLLVGTADPGPQTCTRAVFPQIVQEGASEDAASEQPQIPRAISP
jgi:hypothetical protein